MNQSDQTFYISNLDSQRSSKIGAKQISHQPLSSENLAMITTWIKDCDSHMQCSLKPSQLPTRLVDIGNAKDETSIRLINVADYKDLRDQLSHYVALSYCWGTEAGGQSHLKTTPSSFETFLSCIPYEAIPQTLRDVVQVVRKLGLRYIWIDALCIIQEEADQADWKHESLKMKDVYGNAYLTIAPISSHSSFDGFLASKRYIYAQIPFRSTKRPEMNSIFLLREPTSEGRVWHGTFVDDLRDSTWDHRGWTLQEHELSRRILYFGERTVHFRCDTLSWSGDMDVADSKRDRLLPKASDLSWVSCQIPGLKESFPFDSTYDFWYTICSLYSDRILTDNRDKLPAISGLAEHYSISLKSAGKVDTYMAGLWANDLLRGLLWNVVETPDTSLSPLPTSSCTPSWTWASYNGGVDWYTYGASSRLIRGRCTIMAHLPFIDQSPFGMIDGGCLEIKGCIEKITSIAQAATHDDQTLCEHLSYSAKRNNVVVAECQPDFPFEDLQHWPGGSNLSLLLLGESVDAGHLNRLPWEVGLVLAQAHYGGEPRFVRIGVFRIREESSFFKNSQPQLVMVL